MTQGDVRAVQGLLNRGHTSDQEKMRRLSVAGYLHQLAEQVREGHVDGFEVAWRGDDVLDSEIKPVQASEYVTAKLEPDR